jgi:hypothetical protein
MAYDSELSTKQLKNLKRRLVQFVWETTPKRVIELALICGIKVPKNLIEKYISSE